MDNHLEASHLEKNNLEMNENYLEFINKERIQHGYSQNSLKTYKKYCNKMKKQNSNFKTIYSLESNLSKFKMLNSISFLYKNMRILKNNSNCSSLKIYYKYILCLIQNKKNCIKVDDLINLRHELADYYSFLEDIYQMANNNCDTNIFEQYKIKHTWNDIEILFETQKVLDSFLEKKFFLNDFRFNTQLCIKILNLENSRNIFIENLKGGMPPFKLFPICNNFLIKIEELERFIFDNFVESEFIKNLKEDTILVLSYLKNLFDSFIVPDFVVPKNFKDLENELLNLKDHKNYDPKKLRSFLLEIVEKRLEVNTKSRNMPFLPIFYDIANDFIDYSRIDDSIASLLETFKF